MSVDLFACFRRVDELPIEKHVACLVLSCPLLNTMADELPNGVALFLRGFFAKAPNLQLVFKLSLTKST